MQNPGEPSVEEILDSIKKVIARDNREGAIAERRRRSQAGLRDERAETVEPANADEAEEVLELDEGAMLETQAPAEAAAADTAGHEPEDDNDADFDADALTAAATRKAMRDNFAALATLSQPGARPQIVRSGETSLEGLVREMLRPMLAEWLDTNLPSMVEDLVKAEISRIAGKKS